MNDRLLDHCLRVSAAATRDEFTTNLVRFTRDLGFNTITAMSVVDHVDGRSDFFTVGNMPIGFMDAFDDFESNKKDPVMQHCKRHHVPIVWDQSTYVQAQRAHKWEEQAAFGYHCGIAVAMHLPAGLHLAIGVDRDEALPRDVAEVGKMVASLQLFTVHAEETARRLLVQRPDAGLAPLSHRELETLRWTMEGKTAWEVGRILGIAENTVIRHTQRAAEKLGCRSKHHAAVKALRLGLIS